MRTSTTAVLAVATAVAVVMAAPPFLPDTVGEAAPIPVRPNGMLAPAGPISPDQAATNVKNAPRPERDLFRLAEQVKLRTALSIPKTPSATPPSYAVGDVQEFWIADQDNKNYFSIKAKLLHQSEHVHWWAQDGKNVDVNLLRQSADRFENEILTKNRELFGTEATPGIDGDPRITVLIATTPGAGGYFSASDSYPKLVNPHSNERKMIYMNAESARPGSGNFLATLAHEYQHMIHRNVRPGDQGWIDEGMSVLAEKLNGFGQGGLPASFLARPGTQLNTWSDDAARATNHYGGSFLWVDYFFSHYGGYDGMKNYLKLRATDRASFDRYLEQLGRPERFNDVFADWVVANLVNDKNAGENARWGYYDSTGRVTRTEEVRVGGSKSAMANQFGTVYYSVGGSGNVEVAFQGDSTTRVIGTDPSSGAGMWWGNRGDDMNTNMTRDVDLTSVSSATLNVSLWYNIEDGFDYGYIEVSDDGGQTWTTLKGKYGTTTDPNGQNLGSGYTNKSGGETPTWVREQIDLTPWAGKQVKLRFEYVTDDAFNAPGFAWDDLSIPEIGLSDDGEDDGAWTTNGFVRLGNTIPERFVVQVVTRGDAGVAVQRLDLGDAQTGTATITGLGSGVREAWIAISGTAEWTTEPVSYTVEVRQK